MENYLFDFYNYKLKYDETVFLPTTISKLTAPKIFVKNKTVLDLGCGIGPLAIYFAKNGAKSVTASDIYDKHISFTKTNAKHNNVDIKVIKSDLYDNITETYDVICCDVSGVSKKVAKFTDWFPNGVPTADDTGADIICNAIKQASKYLNDNGELYICTTSFSDLHKIQEMMFEPIIVFDKDIPFSKELINNVDKINPKSYKQKRTRYTWNFSLWKMKKKG
tara:strand:+ start:270 stop:932 length:663 start_codon:yes stop_codon:yes gene_type:complete